MAVSCKEAPATQETWVQSLSLEDPLTKGMATHSSIFAWNILWTEKPCRFIAHAKGRTGLSNFHKVTKVFSSVYFQKFDML